MKEMASSTDYVLMNSLSSAEEPIMDDNDFLLEFLESDCLEEELADSYEYTFELMESGNFQCSMCTKICKTKGGLTRHTNSKHKVDDDNNQIIGKHKELSNALLISLVEESCKDLSEDHCYPSNVRSDLASFNLKIEDISDKKHEILREAKSLYVLLSNKGNVEDFFGKYYARIVPKASSIFYPLSGNTATLLSTKLAEKMVVLSKNDTCDNILSRKKCLSDNEKAAIQYLGGYVLSNLNRKIYKSKHYNSMVGQQHISVLQAGRSSQLESTHKLVDNINRGGLWKITEAVENILTIAELEFYARTNETLVTKSINSRMIVETLCVNQELLGLYQTWIGSCSLEIDKSIGEYILVNILTLYIKVRSFSYAKDIINKFKLKKGKTKSRSLRKEIQKATDRP